MVDVPLLCAQEMGIDGALERVVRVLLHVETDTPRSRHPARVPARGRGAPAGPRAVTSGSVIDGPRPGRRHRPHRHVHRPVPASRGRRRAAVRRGPSENLADRGRGSGAGRQPRPDDEPAVDRHRGRPAAARGPGDRGRVECGIRDATLTDVTSVKERVIDEARGPRRRPGPTGRRASDGRPRGLRCGRCARRPAGRPPLGRHAAGDERHRACAAGAPTSSRPAARTR